MARDIKLKRIAVLGLQPDEFHADALGPVFAGDSRLHRERGLDLNEPEEKGTARKSLWISSEPFAGA
jgi:hypothetical protein